MSEKCPVTLESLAARHPVQYSESDESDFESDSDVEDEYEKNARARLLDPEVRRLIKTSVAEAQQIAIAQASARAQRDMIEQAVEEALRRHGGERKKKRKHSGDGSRSKRRRRSDSPAIDDMTWTYNGRVCERLEAILKETHKQRTRRRGVDEPTWLPYVEELSGRGNDPIHNRNEWNAAARALTYLVDEAVLAFMSAKMQELQETFTGLSIEQMCDIIKTCPEGEVTPKDLRFAVGEDLWHRSGLAALLPGVPRLDKRTPTPPATLDIDDAPSTVPPSPALPNEDDELDLGSFDFELETPADARPPTPPPIPVPDFAPAGELRVMGPPTGLPEPPPTPARPTHAGPMSLAQMAE